MKRYLRENRKELESDPDKLKWTQILAGEIDWKTVPEKELDRLFPAYIRYKKDKADPDVVFFKEKGREFHKRLEGWIPSIIRKKLRDAVNNGMTYRDFKLVYGNALSCRCTIDWARNVSEFYEHDPIILQKLQEKFPIESWFMYPKITSTDIFQEERRLKKQALETETTEIPIENLIDDSEWIEEKDKFRVISRTAMSKILRYFFDQGGNYSGIYRRWELHVNNRIVKQQKELKRQLDEAKKHPKNKQIILDLTQKLEAIETKAKWYVETIVVLGTIAKGSHINKILLDKYQYKKIPHRGKP